MSVSSPSSQRRTLGNADSADPVVDQFAARRRGLGSRTLAGAKQRPRTPANFYRQAVLRRLGQLEAGHLTLVDDAGGYEFGRRSAHTRAAAITVKDRRFYRMVVWQGALGAAEAYIRGYWNSADLTAAMRVLANNSHVLAEVDSAGARLLKPLRLAANWMQRNSRAGSRQNIAAHYDLSNELFEQMLDSTMTYSSGIFPSPDATLAEASLEKYDRICRKLELSEQDHVLEIGSGWGGFAEYAAKKFGCRVTTTTISNEQYVYARRRIEGSGLQNRVRLLQKDYRDLHGEYDKLVSIEMIEAVGRRWLPQYFAQCSRLLKSDGMMLLQAITIPDHRYRAYCRSVDFIQRYVFPGGFLPSMSAISDCVGRKTDFSFLHFEDFGPHYARTLAHWRRNFWSNLSRVKELGFDERFIRTWHYYLCYCEAGFHERQVGVAQVLLAKPRAAENRSSIDWGLHLNSTGCQF